MIKLNQITCSQSLKKEYLDKYTTMIINNTKACHFKKKNL